MAQYQRLSDERWQVAVARVIVNGKLWNAKQLLLKLNRRRNLAGVEAAIAGIERDLRAIKALPSLANAKLGRNEASCMLTLVVYDVADNRRRNKLSKLLEGHGRRVQESVFECFLNQEEMKRLHRKVQRCIRAEEDNVRFYWIPSGGGGEVFGDRQRTA